MSPDKSTPPIQQPKLPYVEPQLTEHGTVEKITGNVGSKGTDGLTGSTVV